MVQRRWIIPGMAITALCWWSTLTSALLLLAPPPMAKNPSRRTVQRRAMLDPQDVLHGHYSHLETLLSTLYVEVLKPAQEHTQPLLWGGPPDPILSAGKSIMPSPNAFSDAGLTTAPPTVSITEKVSDALMMMKTTKANINVIDPTMVIQLDKVLPGFKETGHFLPQQHLVPQDTPESLILEMGSVAKMMRVVNHLPMAAFLYTCAEFFLVKPGYDVYKEELDENRSGAAVVEFLMLSGLRLGILSVIGLFALGLFDK